MIAPHSKTINTRVHVKKKKHCPIMEIRDKELGGLLVLSKSSTTKRTATGQRICGRLSFCLTRPEPLAHFSSPFLETVRILKQAELKFEMPTFTAKLRAGVCIATLEPRRVLVGQLRILRNNHMPRSTFSIPTTPSLGMIYTRRDRPYNWTEAHFRVRCWVSPYWAFCLSLVIVWKPHIKI